MVRAVSSMGMRAPLLPLGPGLQLEAGSSSETVLDSVEMGARIYVCADTIELYAFKGDFYDMGIISPLKKKDCWSV